MARRDSLCARVVLTTLFVCLLLPAPILWAQTSPTDLAELSLSELVNIQVVPKDGESDRRLMVGYRFAYRAFEGYLQETRSLDFDQMLSLFPVVPTRITQEAHIFDASYRWTDKVQITLLVPYIEQSTDHIRRVGEDFNITTRGVADVLVAAAFRFRPESTGSWAFNLGLSLPTGSIDQKGDTPRGANTQVPYTMQTGSGTYDLQPALTFSSQSGPLSWGFQALAILRLGRNDRDYSLGDRLRISGQVGARRGKRVEPWVKAIAEIWQRIDGRDLELNPDIAPVADADLSGGERLDFLLGLRIAVGENRRGALEIEGGIPIYQSLNGPQPKRRWETTIAWKAYFF